MRILVHGTGVIGTTYGHVLDEAGHDVTHYVRPGHDLDRRYGVRIDLVDGRGPVAHAAVADYRRRIVDGFGPADAYDLILVSVPHDQVTATLPCLAANAGLADVLFFGHWWGTFAPFDAYLPGRYLWGFPLAGGGWHGRLLQAAIAGEVRLAEPDGRETERLARISDAFAEAGLAVVHQPRMRDWLWARMAIEAGLAGSALAAGSVERLLGDRELLAGAVLAVRDGFEVCRARGVRLERIPDAAAFLGSPALVAADVRERAAASAAVRETLERHALGDEPRRIFADVLATGRELGVPMPRLAALEAPVEAWARRPDPFGGEIAISGRPV